MNDTTEQTPQQGSGPAPIECRATKDPSVRLFILAAMLVGFGVYCLIDDLSGKYPYVPAAEDINQWATWGLNHFGPYVFIPPGVLAAVLAFRGLKRVFTADAGGLGYLGKDKIAWSQITRLDGSLLQEKGILLIEYGRGKQLKLCDWKLTNFKALVAFIESHVPESART